jgi:hypothetical protein
MLHAPGRFVPQLVGFLKAHVAPEAHRTLQGLQELVMRQISPSAGTDGEPEAVSEEVAQSLEAVKALVSQK